LATYSATKFAVRRLTEALNVEWQVDGIRVTGVMPLFVRTAMVDGWVAWCRTG
jgi:NAD(P)-dependent dehydrogenase (short-subunit alcohol dehydrogenase family)